MPPHQFVVVCLGLSPLDCSLRGSQLSCILIPEHLPYIEKMFLTRYMSAHVVKCLLYWAAAGAIHHINITYGSSQGRQGTFWTCLELSYRRLIGFRCFSEAGNCDRLVNQELLIEEIAQTQQVDLNAKQRFKVSTPFVPLNWLTVTTTFFQSSSSMKRTRCRVMHKPLWEEQWKNICRIILCANSTNKLIASIKSRCLLMRVPAPIPEEVWALI